MIAGCSHHSQQQLYKGTIHPQAETTEIHPIPIKNSTDAPRSTCYLQTVLSTHGHIPPPSHNHATTPDPCNPKHNHTTVSHKNGIPAQDTYQEALCMPQSPWEALACNIWDMSKVCNKHYNSYATYKLKLPMAASTPSQSTSTNYTLVYKNQY